ncbi:MULTISPECIES: aspartate aminotransferase family protein [unclassified Nonomuraea]|uniref:aspartate aminotransferase family protein n=1 Tax=unclassified Nonomuraea TaxID=2593643 RepID=UPI0033EB28A8
MESHSPSNENLLRRHRAVLPPWVPLFYQNPLEIVEGRGRRVTDSDGNDYLDFYSGISTNILGYNVPELREALETQLRTGVVHTSTFYLIRAQIEVAERIAALSGIPDAMVFFTCSGSEAVETALLLATHYRQSQQIIALRYAYHGRTFGGLSSTGDRSWQSQGLSPLRVAFARSGERKHGGMEAFDDSQYVRACVEDLEELINTATPQGTAAMIVEPVQGIAGAIPPAPGQLAAYQEVCKQNDILMISDEVQTGWGRTGRYWGYQWYGIEPDILTFAKGVGNGLTMGGVVARKDIMSAYDAQSISSFGGNPLSTAAAHATLDYIDAHDLPARAGRTGALLLEGLRQELKDEPWVCEVRGMGLLQAVEYTHPGTTRPAPEMATDIQEHCRERGLLVGSGGTFHNCVRIMPPLTLDEQEAREGIAIIAEATRRARQG